MKEFLFCVITFELIKGKTCKAPHTYDEKWPERVVQRPFTNSDSFRNGLYKEKLS